MSKLKREREKTYLYVNITYPKTIGYVLCTAFKLKHHIVLKIGDSLGTLGSIPT